MLATTARARQGQGPPSAVILLGLNRLFAKPAFFSDLRSKGFSYRMVPKASMKEQYWNSNSDRDVGLFIISYKDPSDA